MLVCPFHARGGKIALSNMADVGPTAGSVANSQLFQAQPTLMMGLRLRPNHDQNAIWKCLGAYGYDVRFVPCKEGDVAQIFSLDDNRNGTADTTGPTIKPKPTITSRPTIEPDKPVNTTGPTMKPKPTITTIGTAVPGPTMQPPLPQDPNESTAVQSLITLLTIRFIIVVWNLLWWLFS